MNPYLRFALMIAVSIMVMYVLMYLNTYAIDHIFFSQTRAWMALLMGAAMSLLMLAFMPGMYPNRRINNAIFAGRRGSRIHGYANWLMELLRPSVEKS